MSESEFARKSQSASPQGLMDVVEGDDNRKIFSKWFTETLFLHYKIFSFKLSKHYKALCQLHMGTLTISQPTFHIHSMYVLISNIVKYISHMITWNTGHGAYICYNNWMCDRVTSHKPFKAYNRGCAVWGCDTYLHRAEILFCYVFWGLSNSCEVLKTKKYLKASYKMLLHHWMALVCSVYTTTNCSWLCAPSAGGKKGIIIVDI